MTTTRSRSGTPLHFPGSFILDSFGVIEPPSHEELHAIAADVAPNALPFFVRGLMKSACRRRGNPRWQKVNRSRLELARLCLDRALGQMEPLDEGEAENADDATKRDLVGDAFHIFGEDAARALADKLGVAFDECGEAIERLEHRPN